MQNPPWPERLRLRYRLEKGPQWKEQISFIWFG
jgi:hypothetical protein